MYRLISPYQSATTALTEVLNAQRTPLITASATTRAEMLTIIDTIIAEANQNNIPVLHHGAFNLANGLPYNENLDKLSFLYIAPDAAATPTKEALTVLNLAHAHYGACIFGAVNSDPLRPSLHSRYNAHCELVVAR